MTKPPSHWRVGGEDLDVSSGAIVGVVNVTPDSFSDGGEFSDPHVAIQRGLEMIQQGASIVDVGGESTRPGAPPVPEHEEMRRMLPVVEGLAAAGLRVSIDTYKPGVARSALDAGAIIVNDVTGFRDPAMVEVVAASGCGVVAMHMQGTPQDMHVDPRYDDVVSDVEAYLIQHANTLESAGVKRERIVIDPGIGFGKRAHHSLALLSNLDRLARHGLLVMVGVSRKGFLARVIGDSSRDRLDIATATTTALAHARGARLFRVHDVAKSRDALSVADAIVASQRWEEWLQA